MKKTLEHLERPERLEHLEHLEHSERLGQFVRTACVSGRLVSPEIHGTVDRKAFQQRSQRSKTLYCPKCIVYRDYWSVRQCLTFFSKNRGTEGKNSHNPNKQSALSVPTHFGTAWDSDYLLIKCELKIESGEWKMGTDKFS